ncbi:MAG: flagellar basal-body rod protein FlgF [bacterium]
MIKGLYTSASSMLATRRNLDIVSNNLANASTTGYKKDDGIKRSFPEMLMQKIEKGKTPEQIGSTGTGVHLEGSFTDFTGGSLKSTENNLDFAIEGDGFFVVETPSGRRYTRNGEFSLNQEGELVTQQGYPVLNQEDEPINFSEIEGNEIKVDGEGNIFSGGEIQSQQIQLVDFDDYNLLTKTGENLYEPGEAEAQPVENSRIRQGYLEESNVEIVREMAKMIETTRMYEANQKMIQTMDNTLEKSVNQVGRIG